jgi:hypothetical protein
MHLPNFIQICSVVLDLNRVVARTRRCDQPCMSPFGYIVQTTHIMETCRHTNGLQLTVKTVAASARE